MHHLGFLLIKPALAADRYAGAHAGPVPVHEPYNVDQHTVTAANCCQDTVDLPLGRSVSAGLLTQRCIIQ